jgi:hypothetical protein
VVAASRSGGTRANATIARSLDDWSVSVFTMSIWFGRRGLLAAWGVRFVQAHLYETAAYDPAVWTTTVWVMFVTATLGAWIPARRASRVDPVEALREN